MLVDKITLEHALELESLGIVTIYDPGRSETIGYHVKESQWKENFYQLRTKARTIPRNKIPEHYTAQYLIEVSLGCTDPITNTYQWKYLRGIPIRPKPTAPTQDLEYVYVLTNSNYKDLVKIGMTRHTPQTRLNQINGTGTVHPWEVKFALPVKVGGGIVVEKQVHKYFQQYRYHAKNFNDREMFKIDVFQAIDKVREIGEVFQGGIPILY